MPFQNISMYETVTSNKYDYARQVDVLLSQPDVVIVPVKTLLEKFPDKNLSFKSAISLLFRS